MCNFSHFSNLKFFTCLKNSYYKTNFEKKKSLKIFFFQKKIADFEFNNFALLKMLNYFFLEIPKEN